MGSSLTVEMTAKEKRLIDALRAVGKGTDDVADGFDKATKESKELDKVATRALKAIETNADKATKEISQYQRALDKGKLTQDEFNRAVAMTKEKYDSAGSAGAKAFGKQQIVNLRSMALQYVGVQQGIQAVIGLLRQEMQVRDEAAQRIRESRRGVGSLAQLTDSKKGFQSLKGKAEELFAAGGAESMDEAARAVFSLESAGVMDSFDTFKNLAKSGTVSDIETLARATATISTAFGKQETGSAGSIISKGFAASKDAPSTVPELLEAAAGSGGVAKALGISDEQVLAGTTVLAKSTGSAQQGSTQMQGFLAALDKKGTFKGKSIQEAVAEIAQLETKGEDMHAFFGRKEGLAGFRTLRDESALFSSVLGNVNAADAGGASLAKRRAALPLSDRLLRAATDTEQFSNRTDIQREKRFGEDALLAERFLKAVSADADDDGIVSRLMKRGLVVGTSDVERTMVGDREFVRRNLSALDDDNQRAEFQKMITALDNIDRKTPAVSALPTE